MRRIVLLLATALWFGIGADVRAENVDPDRDGHRYAWSENAGWINALPLVDQGYGMQVDDFNVFGWMWAENLGWVNLHCENRSDGAPCGWGVHNDGRGQLSGLAWSENAGWIDFAPTGGGVSIVDHGAFSAVEGIAWGENIGWIHFIPAAAGQYGIRVDWRCASTAPPAGVPALSVIGPYDTSLTWAPLPGSTAYDVVRGNLRSLLTSGGDFSRSDLSCILRRKLVTELSNLATREQPAPGEAFFYLVRGANCNGNGTYQDDRPLPPGPRDLGIQASGEDCQ